MGLSVARFMLKSFGLSSSCDLKTCILGFPGVFPLEIWKHAQRFVWGPECFCSFF
jgi:hypothetical protein